MSSQRYQEFITERARLLERIKELEAENAELRKRLGEPVTPLPPGSVCPAWQKCQQKQHSFFACVYRFSTTTKLLSTVSVNEEKKCLVKSGKVSEKTWGFELVGNSIIVSG